MRLADVAKARDAGITTALVVPPDGVAPGRSVLVNTAGDRAEEMVLAQPAAMHLHMATLSRQYPGSLMGTVAWSRQALLDAAHYRDEWAAYEKAPRGRTRPRYDAALAAWQDVIAGRQVLFVTAPRENDIRRALALADELKVKVAIAGAQRAQAVAALLKARNVPLLVSVNFDPPKAPTFGAADDDKERRDIEEAEKNPAALHAAGIRFALVSGHAPDFLAGVRKAIERGLPPDVALRAVTLSAAEALGVAERTGSLEAGKIANVVAWSGEPLTKDAKPRYVFVDGELFEPDAKEASPSAFSFSGDQPMTAALLALALAAPPSPPPEKAFAIMGGTVITAGPRAPSPTAPSSCAAGRSPTSGRAGHPARTAVINATGQYVMPGIIDAHSHTAIEEGVNECTDAITPEVRVADVIDHRDIDIYRQLAGGVTLVNVLHGSCNAIGGQNAVLKMRWGRPPDELVYKEAPRGHQVRAGREPEARELQRARAEALPGDAHGRGGRAARGVPRGAGLQARVGGLGEDAAAPRAGRRRGGTCAWRPCATSSTGRSRCTRTAIARTRS